MKNLIPTLLTFISLSFFAPLSYGLNELDTKPASTQKAKKKSKKSKQSNKDFAETQYLLGLAYYKGKDVEKNNKKAIEFLTKAALANNNKAQYALGQFYMDALCGLDKDMGKAVKFFEESAKQNNKDAIFRLACLYLKGEYFIRDIDKALDLFIEAANLGEKYSMIFIREICKEDETKTKALYNLALLYKKNNNITLALEYFEKSLKANYKDAALDEIKKLAKSKNDEAQYLLGKLYEEGEYINISIDKAIKNYELSAKQENEDAYAKIKELAKEEYSQAEYTMGYLYHKGINVSKDLGEAIYWYKRAVGQKNKDAIVQLEKANGEHNASVYATLAYVYKNGTEAEQKKAFQLFKKSANLGNMFSLSNLGVCYEKGVGVKQNHKKAFQIYLKGAKKGNDAAQFNLARAYKEGRGVKQNYKESLKYLEKAAAQNNLDAIVDLGVAYEKGLGVEVDMYKAIEFFKKGMEKDDCFSIFKIAAFYESGEYLEKEPLLALKLFKKSALLGDKESLAVLEEYRQAAKNGNREVIKLLEDIID